MTSTLNPKLVSVAALALVTVEPDLLFPRWPDTAREIEVRVDLDLGRISFYDGLGLPISLDSFTTSEIEHMFNYLSLNYDLNQPYRLN